MSLNMIIDARFCLVRAKVLTMLGKLDEAENQEIRAYEMAHSIGWAAYTSNSALPAMMTQENLLVEGWVEGKADAERQEDIQLYASGSVDEWHALSSAEQIAEWEEFHDRCALGIADDMYFYHVMMNMHLVGYVGH